MKSLRHWNQEDFKIRLRVALYIRRVTQKELAEALHVAPATVSRWQHNKSNYPGLDHLEAAADFLKIDVCWLAFGGGNAPREIHQLLESPEYRRTSTRKIGEAQPKK